MTSSLLPLAVFLVACNDKNFSDPVQLNGPGFVITGAKAGEHMVGVPCDDVNGDGLGEILVSLRRNGDPAGALIVFGKTDEEAVDIASIASGEEVGLGRLVDPGEAGVTRLALVEVGDINGDGFADLGCPSYSPNSSQLQVVFGGPDLPAPLDLEEVATGATGFTLEALPMGEGPARWSISGVGDVNGDGFDDLVVGLYSSEFGAPHYFVYGGPLLAPSLDDLEAGLGGSPLGSGWGEVLRTTGGDFNGDGVGDLLLVEEGSYLSSANAYIIWGSADFDAPSLELGPESADLRTYFPDLYVESVDAVGDVNGDGRDDLVFTGSYQAGRSAFVVFSPAEAGSQTLPEDLGDDGYVIDLGAPLPENWHYGSRARSIAAAGDRDDDGLADLIIHTEERSYVALGKADTTPQVLDVDGILLDTLPLGEHLGTVSGWVALGAKPDDLVISDPDADPPGRTDAGRVYVLFDTPELN